MCHGPVLYSPDASMSATQSSHMIWGTRGSLWPHHTTPPSTVMPLGQTPREIVGCSCFTLSSACIATKSPAAVFTSWGPARLQGAGGTVTSTTPSPAFTEIGTEE